MTLFHRPLLVIFLIIFSINIGYALLYAIEPRVDAEAYDEIATNLFKYGIYQANLDGSPLLDGSITRIGPGYEFFLAGIYSIFGRRFVFVWIIQAILYALSIVMLGKITIFLVPEFERHQKWFFGLLIFFGVFIDAIQLNAMLMTESLTIFLITLVFYIFTHHFQKKNYSIWEGMLIGLVAGILMLVRPMGFLILLTCLGAVFFIRRKHAISYALAAVLVFGAIQIPWIYRNYNIFGTFLFHTAAGGMNLLSGNYPGNHGEFTADFLLFEDLKSLYPAPVDFSRAAEDWYRDFFFHHPFQALGILFEKTMIFFSLTKTSGFWFHYFGSFDKAVTVVISVIQNFLILGTIFAFMIMTILRYIRERSISKRDIFFFCIIAVMIAIPILTVVANRHRLPLAVLSLPLFGIVFMNVVSWVSQKKVKFFSIVAIPLIVTTFIDLSLQFDKFKSHLSKLLS
ncbi:MAG: hypothetical protein AAB407_01785 [Patescibacteria group bacterium]